MLRQLRVNLPELALTLCERLFKSILKLIMMKHVVLFVFCLFTTAAFAQPFAPPKDPVDNGWVATRSLTFNGDLRPFFHGVASGDPSANSVVLWTRVTPEAPGPVSVEFQVATSLAFDNIVASGELTATEEQDYTVKVDVSGLQAGTTYYYYFTALGANSLVGRAKTTPQGGVDHLRFGVVSCSNYEGGFFNAYGALAERNDLDAVIHLGDYIYEYGPGVYGVNLPDRVNEPGNEILSLTDYRTRYSLYRLDPHLIRLHQQHTVISVWDDHESANDSYVDGAENHQPDTEGSWEDRKAISKQVYFEWMPMRDNEAQAIYRAFAYGDLCDLIMLDTRLEGRVEPPTNFDDPDEPVRTMISQTQYDWLMDNLRNSEARWKVIGNQVLFSTFNVGFAAGAFDGTPDPLDIDSIRVAENTFIDNWESYPTQRNSIIDSLRDMGIDNTVIVTGDSHTSWAIDVTKEAVLYPRPEFLNLPQPNPYDPDTGEGYDPETGAGSWAVEFGTPSISSPNFDEAVGAAVTAQFETLMNNPVPPVNVNYNPHVKFVDLDQHGYFILDLTTEAAQADYFYTNTILEDTIGEVFATGAFTLDTENHLQISGIAAPEKENQDEATPTDPFDISNRVQDAAGTAVIFNLYPNPVKDYAFLQVGINETMEVQLSLYDVQGKRYFSRPQGRLTSGLYQIGLELPNLPAGTYFLRLEGTNGVQLTWPVVVE